MRNHILRLRAPPYVPRAPIIVNAISAQIATLVVVVAAISVPSGLGLGLYSVPGIVLLLGIGIMNAWIMLIEILR